MIMLCIPSLQFRTLNRKQLCSVHVLVVFLDCFSCQFFSNLPCFPIDGTGEEQAAVTIASVQQAAAFGDHNIQYQFRTEGGQVCN